MKLLLLSLASVAILSASEYISVKSKLSVNEVSKSILAKIEANKMINVFTVFDHKKNALNAGLKMKDSKVIVFGNPKAGTILMKKNPDIAIELPMKIAIYKNAKDETVIKYKDPKYLEKKYSLQGVKIIKKMTKLFYHLSH